MMEFKDRIETIKANWTKTNEIIYNDAETKFKSLEEAKTKLISKN